MALDVRDRELQLFETNKQLRGLTDLELNQPETRRKIEQQAEAERANGRRLTNLVGVGEDLVKQAMRNPEFGVGHLEKWAEMLQVLKDISGNRMPTVSDLLKQAATAPGVAQKDSKPAGPQAGNVRSANAGKGSSSDKDAPKDKPPVPSVVDIESSQQPPKPDDKPPGDSPPGSPSLRLPVTLLPGAKPGDACPPAQKMDEAIAKQQDLLAEFEKIADELNKILANLEGSTLVKRLKAASRLQNRVAGRLGDLVGHAFGVAPAATPEAQRNLTKDLSKQEAQCSQDVSHIMDDMQAYFDRRHFQKFKSVLDDMAKQDVVGGLRQLGDDLPKENGLSMAQCEYWSDTLDRWAEDLVDPASGGT